MQTLYYTTNNFIRSNEKVIDLAKYRMAGQEERRPPPDREAAVPRHAKGRGRELLSVGAWLLDVCASISVVAVTVTFILQVLG